MSEVEDFDMSDNFAEQIRTNTAVFSAFRTHRMQNDLASKLLDANGNLKPFRTWVKDIQGMTNHYVRNWLNTEYNTAVIRAHRAAEWQRFDQTAHVYPNLRWMPTTSPNQDPLHRQYWEAKLTLPINHPFWDEHRPGDRWNCKCRLRQTDDPANDEVIKDFENVSKQPGLDNNPGKDGKLFNDTHPYFKSSCKVCPFYGKKTFTNRIQSFFNAGNKDCYNCGGINEAIAQSQHTAIVNERNKAFIDNCPESSQHKQFANLKTGELLIGKKPLKRLLSHCHNIDEIETACYVWKHPEKLAYVRPSPLGEGKNLSDPKKAKNVREKVKRGIVMYHEYKLEYKGTEYLLKLEEHRAGFEQFYFLRKK